MVLPNRCCTGLQSAVFMSSGGFWRIFTKNRKVVKLNSGIHQALWLTYVLDRWMVKFFFIDPVPPPSPRKKKFKLSDHTIGIIYDENLMNSWIENKEEFISWYEAHSVSTEPWILFFLMVDNTQRFFKIISQNLVWNMPNRIFEIIQGNRSKILI